jgi:hypothetical protein
LILAPLATMPASRASRPITPPASVPAQRHGARRGPRDRSPGLILAPLANRGLHRPLSASQPIHVLEHRSQLSAPPAPHHVEDAGQHQRQGSIRRVGQGRGGCFRKMLPPTRTWLVGCKAILAELQALKAMGVAIVMDDFGTGYSSLSYLWRFPFDKIKVDRSFMQAYDRSGRNAETVVETIIALGRQLHMRVTVEGIETGKQAAFLDSAKGDQVQGFFFGRPIPASEVGASIVAHFQQTLPTPSSAMA